jgi:hypothetical protein
MDERIVATAPPLPEWAVETAPPAVGADPKGMPALPSWAKEEFPPAQETPLPAWAKETTPTSQEPLVAGEPDQYGYRLDGTKKGQGFFGPLQRPDGKVSTELSIGVDFDGKETLIPALVPTLTKAEVDSLLSNGPITEQITQKAIAHAKQRMAQGKSPFSQPGEDLAAERPDQATIDRMNFVEKGEQFKPMGIGTFATTAVKQLAETPLGIIKGGIEGAKAAIQRPKEIIPAMREAYDYATSPEGQKDIIKAGYTDTKGLITFLPTTFIKFVKNPQKQVTEDPVGTIFLATAIGGGAMGLIGKKLRAKAIVKPEEIKAAVEEVAPDQTKISENLDKLKTVAAPEAPAIRTEQSVETKPIEAKAPIIAPITEAPKQPELVFDIKRQPDGAIRVTVPEVAKPATEVAQTPISMPETPPIVATEPKRAGGGYPPTGEIAVPKAPKEMVYPPKGKPSPSMRGTQGLSPEEMTPFERWQYNNKMGIPNPKPAPKGNRVKGPTELEHYQKMAAEDAVARIEDGKVKWNELAPEEQAVVEQYISPDRVAEFKAMDNIEIVPPFTEADAKAKAAAEIKAKRDRVQGLPEKLATSPEWKPEWDALIVPALEKAKIKPEHRAEATLLLKHGFSMKKVTGTDVPKGMEHYLNTLKTRLKADERFPEAQMPEVKTEEGTLEVEPTAEMAKGEAMPKGKNVIPEPTEVDELARRRERGLEAISRIVDDYESTITDPKEKEMFRVYRSGLRGRKAEAELARRGTEFKATGDTFDKRIPKWEADLQEHGKARRDAVKKAMDEITGDEFDRAAASLADKMEKDLGPVKGPKVGLTVEMAHPIPELAKGAEKFRFPEATEARYEHAKSLIKPTTMQKVGNFLTDAYHGTTRVYQDLPRGPEWIEVTQTLKNNEKQPGIISDKLSRTYKSMYYKLSRDNYDLTTRKAIVTDLLHEADAGRELPFGFSEKSLRDVAKKLDEFTKDNAPVNEALKNRADVWEGVRKEYIYWREKAGHDVEDILTKPDYFRHKILEVAKSDYNKVAPGKKLRLRTGQDFLKKRGGSEKDILSDLVSADYEVMSRMLRDIADAKALVKIREVADKSARFKAEAKAQGVPVEEVIPEEYTKWQPKEGHLFYIADTLPAKIAEKIMTDELTNIGVVKDKLRKSLAMGRERETWIIKKELAATLDKLGAQKEAAVMGSLFKGTLTKWKQWTLLSPRRALKYNFRNLTGDSDHVFVGSPGVFSFFPKAMNELWPVYAGDRPMTGNLKDFAERGGLQTTLQVQDIGAIKKLPVYRNLYKPNVLNDINIFKKYWRFANNATNYRESIGRYAAFLKYLEDMQKDPKGRPKNFGASFPEEIMALSDIKDRAFRLSNELLGPYDEVSPVGVEISSKIFPFWRWKEVNAKFYARIIKNIANNDEAAVKTAKTVLGGARIAASVGTRTLIGAGRFAVKAMGLTAMLTAWNNLMFEDEEKDLPEDVRNRLHLVLGRDKDGQVIAFTRLGALGDMLEWFGMDNAYGHMNDFLNGRKTMKDIVTDMVKSPVNIVMGGVSPFIKAPLETLTRRTLFPDAFDPKVIRDRGIFLARQVGVEEEYKAIAGKPGKPYLSTVAQMAVYKYDPLETAYYDFLDIKRDYLKSIGRGGGGAYLSPSSGALYNMKLAYRWGEHDLVKKYMDEYVNIVATQHQGASGKEIAGLVTKGIKQSFSSLHPLSGIKQDDWADYVKSLDPEAKDTLAKALRFYSEILLGKSDIKESE